MPSRHGYVAAGGPAAEAVAESATEEGSERPEDGAARCPPSTEWGLAGTGIAIGVVLLLAATAFFAFVRPSAEVAATGNSAAILSQMEVTYGAPPQADGGTDGIPIPADSTAKCKLQSGWDTFVTIFKCPVAILPCSKAGDDCTRTQCCAEVGHRCYEKTEYYASCREDCEAGDHGDEDGVPWTCAPRGERSTIADGTTENGGVGAAPTSPVVGKAVAAAESNQTLGAVPDAAAPAKDKDTTACAKVPEDCTKIRCCDNPSFRCYSKNQYFAMCKPSCTPGAVDPNDDEPAPWECKMLE